MPHSSHCRKGEMALLTIMLMFSFISAALSCNGYEAKDLKIEECSGKSDVISFQTLNPTLRDNCTVRVNGCIVVKKQVQWGNARVFVKMKTAYPPPPPLDSEEGVVRYLPDSMGTYKVERKANVGMPIKFTGQKDLCKLLQDSKANPEISMIFQMFNLDQDCPLKAGKICGNEKGVSVAKYKDHIKMMQGVYEGIIEGTSNAGSVCIKASFSIVPKGGGISKPSMTMMG